MGAALAPRFQLDRLLLGLLAFALALGIAAHALDELSGRPLGTGIPRAALLALAGGSLLGACAVGVVAAATWGWGLLAFVAVGAVLVPAYNLELWGGVLHTDLGFALAWGAFPALTGYFVEAQTLHLAAVAAALYAALLSAAQRTLSTPVRQARRTHATTAGVEPLERALRLLGWAAAALGCALVLARLT